MWRWENWWKVDSTTHKTWRTQPVRKNELWREGRRTQLYDPAAAAAILPPGASGQLPSCGSCGDGDSWWRGEAQCFSARGQAGGGVEGAAQARPVPAGYQAGPVHETSGIDAYPNPDWIRIWMGEFIQIRLRTSYSDLGKPVSSSQLEKTKEFYILKRWMFSVLGWSRSRSGFWPYLDP